MSIKAVFFPFGLREGKRAEPSDETSEVVVCGVLEVIGKGVLIDNIGKFI